MTVRALLFDFDGVLIESEAAGNRQIADWLSANGHPTTAADSMANFMGLSGTDFLAAIGRWIGGPIPESFHAARRAEDERVMREVATDVRAVSFPYGHQLAEECPTDLAEVYLDFFSGHTR